jgi:hypothetical protein
MLSLAGPASASSIGIFFAADASDCDATHASFSSLEMYVIALLSGDAAVDGITGAEFRLDGVPSDWFHSVTYNPAASVSLGNPLTGGCNIGFPTCQPGPMVLLYTINSFATTSVSNLTYHIDRHTNPTNPFFQCPLLVLCDVPVYSKICVTGGTAFVNGGSCTVGVKPASWSQIKSMYE